MAAKPSSEPNEAWLEQLRDEPIKALPIIPTDSQLGFSVFRVPDILRSISPAYYVRKELQLGLIDRTSQTSGTHLLKIDIARILHARLSLSNRGGWETFTKVVVGEAQIARGQYQNAANSPSNSISDEVVQYLLALDALFLVVFFQFLNGKTYFMRELEQLETRLAFTARDLIRSDFLLLENQVPMYLLKNVVEQLCTVVHDPEGLPAKVRIENELDNVLKVAVYHLYPLGHPDASPLSTCGFQRRLEENEIERFYDNLDKRYPLDNSIHCLQNCSHLLDCVYVVVCGHSIPFPNVSPAFESSSTLESIPSATRLQAIGISITDTASTLDNIELKGVGYVTSARLILPKVDIYDFTETVFHNLAVHEQLMEGGRRGDVRCFLQCMASLSSDLEDLRLLLDHGVIDNKVGNNVVLGMWDRIMRGVCTPLPSSSWLRCYQDIHNHRKNRVKRWRREVWVLFFSKPWIFVGLMGAIAILFLTAVQTWFTVVNSSHRKWRWPSNIG